MHIRNRAQERTDDRPRTSDSAPVNVAVGRVVVGQIKASRGMCAPMPEFLFWVDLPQQLRDFLADIDAD